MTKFNHSMISEFNRQKHRTDEQAKKKRGPKLFILYKVFRCILNSNIDKNFTRHNYAKFDDLSHDITVRLIWTTRSTHYVPCRWDWCIVRDLCFLMKGWALCFQDTSWASNPGSGSHSARWGSHRTMAT